MPMRWYLLKTWAGKEEELVKEIHRTVPPQMYKECFVIYQERIWRKQQKSIVHTEPLFPGCVFLTCQEIKPLFYHTEYTPPSITAQISCGSLSIFPMTEEDAAFLERISGDNHIVKLSYVGKDDKGNICRLSEPLNGCQGQIERMQFKKRYAMIRHRLWGEEQVLVLGIILKEDAGQTFFYLNKESHFDREIPMEEKLQ